MAGFFGRVVGSRPDLAEKVDQVLGDLPRPRDHHYIFAHHVLRSVAMEQRLKVLAVLASPQADEFLRMLWQEAYTAAAASMQQVGQALPPRLEAEVLRVTTGTAANHPTAIVTLPPPLGITEAYMVGIVAGGVSIEQPHEEWDESSELRYFTLERGVGDDLSANRTVLCEWTGERHANYGDGPPPDPASFAAAIERLLSAGSASG